MFDQAPAPNNSFIKEATIQTFQKDVLDASMKVPVLVDFWADWCQPCKELTPTLEKIVGAMAGKIHLIKINADVEKELAQQLRIQSLPTVMAFKDGQPVDGFAGTVPESEIKALIEKLLVGGGKSPVEQLLETGKEALKVGDHVAAIEAFGQIAQSDPANAEALGYLAQAYIATGHIEEAKQILATVAPTAQENAAVKTAKTSLELQEAAMRVGDIAEVQKTAIENPEDLEAQFNHALALIGQNQLGMAGDILLNIMTLEAGWNDDAARKQLVKLFEVTGHTDPFTLKYRRKLSSLLFS